MFAGADGFVVFDTAIGGRSTVARVPADSVEASFVRGTFAVADASTDLYDCLHRIASTASAADVPRWTHADHGTDGY